MGANKKEVQLKGRGFRETAAAWRLEQELAALKAACLEAPGREFPPLRAALEAGRAFASLGARCGGGCEGDSDGGDPGGGAAAPVVAAAAAHMRELCRRLGGGQFAASLLHAHAFLAWSEVQAALAGAAATAAAAPARDFLGPAAPWRLATAHYGGLVDALGWHALLLDMLLWLPAPAAPAAPAARARLLGELAARAPAAAAGALRLLLPTAGACGGGAWVRALLGRLDAERAAVEVARAGDRLALLLHLARQAAAGLLSGADGGSDAAVDDEGGATATATAAALGMLEQLLVSWQGDVAAAAADDPAAAALLRDLAAALTDLQPLLRARMAATTAAGVAPLAHANARIMLALGSWRGVVGAGAVSGAGEAAGTPAAETEAPDPTWQRLLDSPAQPEAIWGGAAAAPWQAVMRRRAPAPAGSAGGASGVGASATAAATSASRPSAVLGVTSLIASLVARENTRTKAPQPEQPTAAAAAAPLLVSPGAAAAATTTGTVDAAAHHCLALACAWLTPGALSWWPLPRAPQVRAAAGADAFAPARLLAALLDMLAHCCAAACGPAGDDDEEEPGPQAGAPALCGRAAPLLVALAAGVGGEVSAAAHQRAILEAAYGGAGSGGDDSGAGRARARRLEAMQERLAASAPAAPASAAAALVAVSNRLVSRDAAGAEVVPSREQRAAAAAAAARALLPHALLWPRAVLRRLAADAVGHAAQQPVIVEVLSALAPLCLQAPGGGGGGGGSSAMPGRLLREVREQLLGPQPPPAGARAAAASFVTRLLRAGLLEPRAAARQLAAAPLEQLWDAWVASGGDVDSGGGDDDDGGQWGRGWLRMLLDLTDLMLLPAPQSQAAGAASTAAGSGSDAAAAVPAAPALPADAWWRAALGLCAAAERLRGDCSGGDGAAAPDLPALSQAEAALERAVKAAAAAAALQTDTEPGQPCGPSAAEVAEGLAALPWARRLALLPLAEALVARQPDEAPALEGLLRPALPTPQAASTAASRGPDAAATAAAPVARRALAFAASSDSGARLLARHLLSADAGSEPGGQIASQIASDLAAALRRAPGAALRRALLLALAELLPFATEAAGRRALLVALPAALQGCLEAPGGDAAGGLASAADQQQQQQVLADAAAMQLACRAALLAVTRLPAVAAAAPAARQQAAEQSCRHVSALAGWLVDGAGDDGGQPQPEQKEQQQQTEPCEPRADAHRRLDAARLCLREACALAGALGRACGGAATAPLQPLLLKLLGDVCGAPLEAVPEAARAPAATGDGDGAETATDDVPPPPPPPPPPSSLILAGLIVAPTGRPFSEALAWAARQLAPLPPAQRALLRPALAHLAAAAALPAARAARMQPVGGGGGDLAGALQDEAEGVVGAALEEGGV